MRRELKIRTVIALVAIAFLTVSAHAQEMGMGKGKNINKTRKRRRTRQKRKRTRKHKKTRSKASPHLAKYSTLGKACGRSLQRHHLMSDYNNPFEPPHHSTNLQHPQHPRLPRFCLELPMIVAAPFAAAASGIL